MTKSPPRALIALGCNIPTGDLDLKETLIRAITALETAGLKPSATSRFFTTPCFPKGAGPDYVNAAFASETDMPADEILTLLHQIEADFLRERDQRWGARSLDLDLLAVDNTISPDRETFLNWFNLPLEAQMSRAPDQLILPHPRIQDRGFVLIPLSDIAPDWIHPVFNLSVQQMISALPADEIKEIVPI